jgi:putative addiction module component (TIGR02574 family)
MERDLSPEPNVEAAWADEIKRRLADIDTGIVELIPWEEVREELFCRAE